MKRSADELPVSAHDRKRVKVGGVAAEGHFLNAACGSKHTVQTWCAGCFSVSLVCAARSGSAQSFKLQEYMRLAPVSNSHMGMQQKD